jgi:hypothetical protein
MQKSPPGKGKVMNRKRSFFIKIHWIVDLFFVLGVVLFFVGAFLHPHNWPAVLLRIFIDAGAVIAVAGVIAHLLS